MFLRCLLVPTAAGINPTCRLDTALKLSRRLHAHINVLYISADPASSLASLPQIAVAAGVTVESILRERRQEADDAKALLASWCRRVGIPLQQSSQDLNSTFASWNEEVGDVETVVALIGRVNDIILVDRPDNALPFTERAFDAAVFSAGRPALMIPSDAKDAPLRHVVIAWNGSLESARLIGQSIALLHEAERVSIIKARDRRDHETELADLASYLSWHGIRAGSFKVDAVDDLSVGNAILAQAEHIDATMLLMGAYTHSRIRQFLLGGVTRHVITNTRIPVLMAH